ERRRACSFSDKRKKPRRKAVAFETGLFFSLKHKNHGARPWHSARLRSRHRRQMEGGKSGKTAKNKKTAKTKKTAFFSRLPPCLPLHHPSVFPGYLSKRPNESVFPKNLKIFSESGFSALLRPKSRKNRQGYEGWRRAGLGSCPPQRISDLRSQIKLRSQI